MDFKKALPHLLAILFFVLCTAVFFKPLVFDGKIIRQDDIELHTGMAKEIKDYRETHNGKEPLWTNSMFSGMPAYYISTKYPNNLIEGVNTFFRAIIPHPATAILLCMIGFYLLLLAFGCESIVAGVGAIAFAFSSYFFVILQAGHNSKAYAIAYMAPVIAGAVLTFRGKRVLGAALLAIALALEIGANHLQITYYLVYIGLMIVLYELIRHYEKKELKEFGKSIGILLVGAGLAVLPNITHLKLGSEYLSYSTRGKTELTIGKDAKNETGGLAFDYATQWSYGKAETMTLLIPNIVGGASKPMAEYAPSQFDSYLENAEQVSDRGKNFIRSFGYSYFGPQPNTSGPVYVGAIICLLFLLGFFIVDDKIKWWILGLTLLAIMLSWGKNFEGFNKWFFNTIPGYNKFRAVSMALVIAEFTMPILAIFALREIMNNPDKVKERLKYFYVSAGVLIAICLFVWLSPSTFITASSKELLMGKFGGYLQRYQATQQEMDEFVTGVRRIQLSIASADAGRSLFFLIAGAGAIYAFVRFRFNKMIFVGAIGLLVTIDLWSVGARYLSDDVSPLTEQSKGYREKPAEEEDYTMTKADQQIKSMAGNELYYRVYNTQDPLNDATTSYYHKSIGGYSAVKMKRYQELWDYQFEPQYAAFVNDYNKIVGDYQQKMQDSTLADTAKAKLNMTIQTDLAAVSRKRYIMNMLNTRFIINGDQVQQNPDAYGNAWFVKSSKIVPKADSEIVSLGKVDPKDIAVIDKRFEKEMSGLNLSYDPTATIKLTAYEPNALTYESDAKSEQLAVFSDIYYDKGWDAYVDGKLTPHFRADYVLRAMRVPAGKHKIEFRFEPKFYETGQSIALFSSLLLFAAVGFGIYVEYRRRSKAASSNA